MPEEIEQAGRTAQRTAEAVPGETRGVLGASDTAEAGLRGWQTGGELNACTDEWKRLLDDLSREMDSQGDKLIQTAVNYRTGEQDASRAVTAPGSGAPAPSDHGFRGARTMPAPADPEDARLLGATGAANSREGAR
ncbi:hypothetical protein [Kitasatospora sp. NPDC088134]|uniref:hypothetical protein n=1 Tax=Kitasatospora sp. NPDC088134 TaxID=3364071 RepID=UPI0038122D80